MEIDLQEQPDYQLVQLHFINRIACLSNAALQTDDLLPSIASEIIQLQTWDRVVIGLRQSEDMLQIVVDQPRKDKTSLVEQYATPWDFQLISEVLNTGETSILQDTDPAIKDTPIEIILNKANLKTVLSVVLGNQDTNFGSIVVANTTSKIVSPEEVQLFETICEIVSTAINRIYQYEEVHQSNRLKSAFLATVTHEMRTPVTSIIGYSQMVNRGKFGPLPEIMQEPMEYILHSSNRIHRLVNDLLDFSKMEAGHFSVDLEDVDIAHVVQAVAGVIRPQIEDRNLSLVVDIEPDLPLVRANGERIEQVLTNLVANAVKFTDEGTITVQAKVLIDNKRRVRLSVTDMGIGITPEHQALIFGEYQQIKNQHTLRFAGTGLGLAISRRLVELMGGKMSLHSEFGVGSTFFCDLRMVRHPR